MLLRKVRQLLGLAALAAVLFVSTPVRALGIDDISELFFSGPSGFGFDAGEVGAAGFAIAFSATPADQWIAAGHVSLGLPIEIEIDLGTVHQHPQARGAHPDPADPFIADSAWTVRNASGATLIAPLLVFTTVDPGDTYPDVATGLDGDLLRILEYSFGGVDYLFGVVVLPDLEVGESTEIDVRYVVAGPLVEDSGGFVMPPLGVMTLGSYALVPEASSLALLGLGLWLVLARGRYRASLLSSSRC